MNKKRVDQWIPKAKEALEAVGIAEKGKISKGFRGQIASFGAAVVMGSFKSAVAFFSKNGGSKTEREKLVEAMYFVIKGEKKEASAILDEICKPSANDWKSDFIDASIAIKLAMNFFELTTKEGDASNAKSESAV